jgi:hypothetical protein
MDAVYLTAVAKVCQQEVSQMANDEFPITKEWRIRMMKRDNSVSRSRRMK